jgi:hypothetical protein
MVRNIIEVGLEKHKYQQSSNCEPTLIFSCSSCQKEFLFEEAYCKVGQGFQSLLWWIPLFDFFTFSPFPPLIAGFNPCYGGFLFLTYLLSHKLIFCIVSILVMVDSSF